MLLCTVRDCRLPLTREPRRLLCARGHSFDVARSGYLNLLQPQDRRSKRPGDSPQAIAARRRWHDSGVTRPLLAAIAAMLDASGSDTILEAGCGEGFFLGSLAGESGCQAWGVDISTAAADQAARRYPDCHWVVANADRFLPFAGRSFSAVLSITGRMNAAEFRRVLRRGGRLLAAVPAPEDLIELRGRGRDRTARTIAAFAPRFQLDRQERVTTTADLDAGAVEDVLHSIYRPLRPRPPGAMKLTLSLDLLLLRGK